MGVMVIEAGGFGEGIATGGGGRVEMAGEAESEGLGSPEFGSEVDMAAIIALEALLFRFPRPIPSSSPSSSAPLLMYSVELNLNPGEGTLG